MNQRAALSTQRNAFKGRAVFLFLGLMFFGVGSVLLYVLTIRPTQQVLAARSWVATPCTIISSEVKTHRGDKGSPTYSVEIAYSYDYLNRTYRSSRYHFLTGSSSGYNSKAQVVRDNPRGHKTTCYVDPNNPSEAVLERGYTAEFLFGLVPIPFVLIGFGALVAFFRMGRRDVPATRGLTDLPYAGSSGSQSSEPDDGHDDREPLVLKPAISRGAMLVVLIGICAFWNGISGFLFYQAYQEALRRGGALWFVSFPLIFLSIFLGIGALIFCGVVYAFLSLFNPVPVLTLSRRRIPLGGTARLSWMFTGRAGRMQSLKISLRGLEAAKHQAGKNSHTDSNVFYEQVLAESSEPNEIAEGEIELAIPTQLMHSFEGKNNTITWQIAVHGAIPRWPDLQTEFPITVTPHESSLA